MTLRGPEKHTGRVPCPFSIAIRDALKSKECGVNCSVLGLECRSSTETPGNVHRPWCATTSGGVSCSAAKAAGTENTL